MPLSILVCTDGMMFRCGKQYQQKNKTEFYTT